MKRFYSDVSIAGADGSYHLLLDTRPLKTVGGQPQSVPTRALAQALADEWSVQGEKLDPALFRFRDLVDFAIDIAQPDRATTVDKLLAFAETDTLCYFADPEAALFQRQQQMWEPLLKAFEAREGIRLNRISGIMHRPQPADTIEKLRGRLDSLDKFTLAGLQALTSLTASLALGLTALEAGADHEAMWNAANLEELWQVELWGKDSEAEARLAKRTGEFLTAFEFVRLLRS